MSAQDVVAAEFGDHPAKHTIAGDILDSLEAKGYAVVELPEPDLVLTDEMEWHLGEVGWVNWDGKKITVSDDPMLPTEAPAMAAALLAAALAAANQAEAVGDD